MDDYNPTSITPLGVQLNPTTGGDHADVTTNLCTLNINPTLPRSIEDITMNM